MTIRDALHAAERRLRDVGVDPAGVDACLMMAHALDDTLSHLPTRLGLPLDPSVAGAFESLLARRLTREPLAYVLGDTGFMGLRILCDPRAFIPRPDTEVLVEAALDAIAALWGPPSVAAPFIADIGTGTGCIALALAHALPRARVFATDASGDALELAADNARLNGLQDRLTLLHGADLRPLAAAGVLPSLTVVVSNPPYIPAPEIPGLDPEVAFGEPKLALDGGPDGLSVYRRLVPLLHELPALRIAAFEVGVDGSRPVSALLRRHLPTWTITTRLDLDGLERVVLATAVAGPVVVPPLRG